LGLLVTSRPFLASISNIIPIFKPLFGNIYTRTLELTKIKDNVRRKPYKIRCNSRFYFSLPSIFDDFAAEFRFIVVVPAPERLSQRAGFRRFERTVLGFALVGTSSTFAPDSNLYWEEPLYAANVIACSA
jgi:hypothetical protein